MNVLFYELPDKLQILVSKLQKLQDICLYFAFNENEFKNLTKNIHPDIIFIHHHIEVLKMKCKFINDENVHIYIIDESVPKLNITEFPTHKRVSINKILKK